MVDPSPPKVVKKPSPNERRLRTLLKQAGASMKAKRLVKAEKQYRRWLTLAGNKHPGAAKVRRKLKSVSKRLRSPPVIRRPKVARIKVTLSPKKAVYALTDRPRAKAVAYDAAGKVVKGVRSLKWSVIGKAKLKDNHLRFKSESRGKIKACIGRVCGVARYMSLDDTGLP
jgi:hypothetical protein